MDQENRAGKLLTWARWWYCPRTKPTCENCRGAQEQGEKQINCQGIDTVSVCPLEAVPKLSEENQRFFGLWQWIEPGLLKKIPVFLAAGENKARMEWVISGVDYQAIELILQKFNIPEGQHPIIYGKCLIMAAVHQEVETQRLERNG